MKPIEEYFDKFPLLHGFKKNWKWLADVNHANPFYSPLYYLICRGIQAKHILEIGCEHGYSSYMLAQAAKETDGTYYCIERSKMFADQLKKGLEEEGFPHKVIWADSKDIKAFEWAPYLDFVLLDGEHTKEAIEHEFDMLYPKIKEGGYIALHDIDAWSVEGFLSTKDNPKYDFEYITFHYNYGIGLLRKKPKGEEQLMKNHIESMRKENEKMNWVWQGEVPKPGQITVL